MTEPDYRYVRAGAELLPGLWELDDCPPVMKMVTAPWEPATVTLLNDHQRDDTNHPYTCERHTSVALFATRAGWVCARKGCRYQQRWAWAAHALTPRP